MSSAVIPVHGQNARRADPTDRPQVGGAIGRGRTRETEVRLQTLRREGHAGSCTLIFVMHVILPRLIQKGSQMLPNVLISKKKEYVCAFIKSPFDHLFSRTRFLLYLE